MRLAARWCPACRLLEELAARAAVLLERDENFPSPAVISSELDAIAAAITRGNARRHAQKP